MSALVGTLLAAGGARGRAETRRAGLGAVLPFEPIATSTVMREVLAAAEDVALASTTVLILGESGTGKEILARHIHRTSSRAGEPWVAVNCAALPTELLEGELFGHERGAFTGATGRRIGRIEQANRGTLLLDEISELPLPLQAKLLRVLQEREVDRIGGARAVPVDVRVIATSNRPLGQMVEAREFRADLYYRLNVFPIELPPLRERRDDIAGLAEQLIAALSSALGRPQPPALTPEALRALEDYAFPGNVRELGNILERALVRCRAPHLDLADLNPPARVSGGATAADSSDAARVAGEVGAAATSTAAETPSELSRPGDPAFPATLPLDLQALERLAISEALRIEGGNRTHAARRLGISLRTLRNKLRLYRTSDGQGGPAGQALPGTNDPASARARSTTLARPSQSPSRWRAA